MEIFTGTNIRFITMAATCLVLLIFLLLRNLKFAKQFAQMHRFSWMIGFSCCWLFLELLLATLNTPFAMSLSSPEAVAGLSFLKAFFWIPLGLLFFEITFVVFARRMAHSVTQVKYYAYVAYLISLGIVYFATSGEPAAFLALNLVACLLLVLLPLMLAAFNCFFAWLDAPPTKERYYAGYTCIAVVVLVLFTACSDLIIPHVIENRLNHVAVWRGASLNFALFLFVFYQIVVGKVKYRAHSKMVFSLARSVSDGIIAYNKKTGAILFSNFAVASLLRLPNEKIRKKNIHEFLPIDDSILFKDHGVKAFAVEVDGHSEEFLSILFSDSELFGVQCCVLMFSRKFEDDATVRGAKELLLREQLQQQAMLEKMREEIRRKELLLQTFIDNMPMQVSVKNDAGVIILQNRQDRLEHGDMLGMTEGQLQDYEQKAYAGEKTSFETVEYDEDKTTVKRGLNYTYVPIGDIADEDKVNMILKICRDITDQMNLNIMRLRLMENERRHTHLEELGTLAGTIAHEFNNIHGAQLGFLMLAKSMIPKDTPGLQYLEQVEVAGARSKELIDKLLQTARSKQDEEKRETDFYVEGAVKNVLTMLQPSMPESVLVENSITNCDVRVFGNDVEFCQVLSNLFNNAVYAMREKGGVLSLSLEVLHFDEPCEDGSLWKIPAGDFACIKVGDTGEGISSNVLQRLFSPLFTTKPPGEGLGLGLYTSITLARAAHGEITVQTTLGKGSTFKVYWPLFKN